MLYFKNFTLEDIIGKLKENYWFTHVNTFHTVRWIMNNFLVRFFLESQFSKVTVDVIFQYNVYKYLLLMPPIF